MLLFSGCDEFETGLFAEKIAEGWVGFTRTKDENDRVHVIMQTAFFQELQGFVKV